MGKRKSKCKFALAQAVERAIEPYRMERLERRVMLNAVSFDVPPEYPTGYGPNSVTTRDFNGDGKPDLAVANINGNTVSVRLNNGNGTFATKIDYATGAGPWSVTTGDFNGDGKPDLAVANFGGNTVSVLLNNGNGTFGAKQDFPTAAGSDSVTTGDFNGDGKPDLAVANGNANTVSVLLNNGNGTFAAKQDFPTGLNPYSVTTGDFNGDGKPDLAVANGNANTVSVLLNNGNDTFATKIDYATGSDPTSVTTGDFNGDGKADLAVANFNGNTVSVLLNNGNSTFGAKRDFPTGLYPDSVTTADFNGDGKPDLAVANGNGVSVLLNNGNGNFATKIDYATGAGPRSVTAGDFNGDGKPDLAVANANGNTVSVLLNYGNGTFAARQDFATGSVPLSVTTGDFNGDGKPDLAVANGNAKTVSVLLNNGNGTFAPKIDYATGVIPESVTTGDFNGDGKPDLAVANSSDSTVSVLLNNGNGTFATKIDYATGAGPRSVTAGDFNGDGKPDLAVANLGANTVSVLLNDGNGIFATKIDYATGAGPRSVTAGDFNGDGKPDLAVANSNDNTISVLLNYGNGTFAARQDFNSNFKPYSVTTGDFNGDGKPDLAVANSNDNTVSVLLNTTGIQPAPASPGLSASPGQTTVNLAPSFFWNVAGTASEYGLYISKLQTNGTYALVFDSTTYPVTISGNTNSFQLPTGILVNGGQYRWNMNAKIGGVWGAYTGRLYFVCTTTVAPPVPGGLNPAATGPHSVQVSWNTAAGATGYALYRSTSATGPWTGPIYSGPGTSYLDSGNHLAPSTTYYYAVTASNIGGASARSGAMPVSTPSIVTPQTPTLTVVAVNAGTVNLSWTTVAGASYQIERSVAGGAFSTLVYEGVGITSVVDTALSNSTPLATYSYRISSWLNGVPSIVSTAQSVLVSSLFQKVAAIASALLSVGTSAGIAKVYQWNWNASKTGGAFGVTPLDNTALGQVLQLPNKKTIVLTHGWNDLFTPTNTGSFIYKFAEKLSSDEAAALKYNVLAVDWYDSGLPDGSNPNNLSPAEDFGVGAVVGGSVGGVPGAIIGGAGYALGDAQKSATNGIDAGAALGKRFGALGVQSQSLELIGHSNGGGFMASLALELKSEGKPNVGEIVSLDAPWLTMSYHEVLAAAPAANFIDNYYMPLAQSNPSSLWGCNPSLGFGAPMDPKNSQGKFTNFELNYQVTPSSLDVGHLGIPFRFATSALPSATWGFHNSPFAATTTQTLRDQEGGIWVEGASAGVFTPVVPLDSTLEDIACLGELPAQYIAEIGQAAFDKIVDVTSDTILFVGPIVSGEVHQVWSFTVDGAIEVKNITVAAGTTIRDTFVSAAKGLWDGTVAGGHAVVKGTKAFVDTSVDTVTSGFHWLEGKAASLFAPGIGSAAGAAFASDGSVLASIDLHIPADAGLMRFDLTVADAGNQDTLQVILGNDLLGQVGLASQQVGGRTVEFWVGDHAGQDTTLSFYMPSAVASSADFTIGNVYFTGISTNSIPTAFQALATSATTMHLAWSAPAASIDGSVIERSTNGQPFAQIASTAANVVGFDDPGLAPGQVYAYRIHAYSGTVNYDYAATPSVMTFITGANTVYIKKDADQFSADITINGGPMQRAILSSSSTFSITGDTGNDTLTLDFSNGNPLPSGGLTVDGGAGVNTVAIIGTSGDDTLTASATGLTFTGGTFGNVPITTANVQSLQFHGGSGGNDSVNLTGGSYTLDADTPTGTPNVSVGVQVAAIATFTGDQHLANLTINGGTARMDAAVHHTMNVKGLSITGNGLLDIANSYLYVDSAVTAFATVKQYIDAGFNINPGTGFGDYSGRGGISSSAVIANADYRGVGYYNGALQNPGNPDNIGQILGPDSNSGAGTGIGLGQIFIRPTLTGDLNGDGVVNAYDVTLFNTFGLFNQPTNLGYQAGDLNGDGIVNAKDVVIFNSAGNFNGGGYPFAALPSAVAAKAAVAAVVSNPPVASTPLAGWHSVAQVKAAVPKALARAVEVKGMAAMPAKSHKVLHHSVRKGGHKSVVARIGRGIGVVMRLRRTHDE